MFIKNIKQGKIKESLFCICDLAYEKYFTKKEQMSTTNKPKKISIIEKKENVKYINKVSVNLFEENLSKMKANIEIYFIEMSKLLKENNNKFERKEKNIEIKPKDIIIIGLEHRYWFIVKNLL